MVMKVLPLDSHLEPVFWKHVYQDIPHYYFFILDVRHDRPSTSVWLALNEQNRIAGMMMTYEERIVQLRGGVEAAKALLAELDTDKVRIQGLEEHKSLVLEKFEKVNEMHSLDAMTLRKGEETDQIRHSVVALSPADAEDIAALMRHGDPEWWGEVTAEKIADRMHGRVWLGIRADDQLASIGGARLDDWGSCITTVVTHKAHRNKGYATSIVSALVDQILQKSSLVLIYVESDNAPALRAYTKVGFKPYRRYLMATVERRHANVRI